MKDGDRLHLAYNPRYAGGESNDRDVTIVAVLPGGDLTVNDGDHTWTLLGYEIEHGLVMVTATESRITES